MADRLFLHVGLMKSGTSYLQRRLDRNRGVLADAGYLFPGNSWGDQVRAVGDLLGRQRLGSAIGDGRTGAWQRLVDEVVDWSGPAVMSMELLGAAAPEKAEAAVASFGEIDVQVVITARDLNRAIPAMWQEGLKNGRTTDWVDYLDGVRANAGPGRQFWREQDLPRIVRTWGDVVGSDNVTVVTVPPPGAAPDVLWERFCAVVGLPADQFAPVARTNESLSASSAMLMLQLNRVLAEQDLSWPDYNALVKRGLANNVLAGAAGEPRLGLPVSGWVRRRSTAMLEELASLDVRVHGSLGDLAPVAVPGVKLGKVGDADLKETAVKALAGLIGRQARASDGSTTSTIPDPREPQRVPLPEPQWVS